MRERGGRVAAMVAGGVALACGLAVAVATLAADTFDRAEAGEAATDLVRPELEEDGLAAHRADYELTEAALTEQYEDLLPDLAERIGATPAAFEDVLRRRYPDVAELVPDEVRADSLAFAEGIVVNLEQHQDDFESADDIPMPGLPMTAGPWVAVAFAATLVVAGIALLLRPGPGPLVLLAVVGVAAVVGTLAVGYPYKAADADELLDTLNVTPALAAETRDILLTVQAAADESERRLYPDVARSLGVPVEELSSSIDRRFPAVAEGRRQGDAVFQRYLRRVEIREGGLAVVPKAKRFPLEAVTWWAIVPGTLVAATAGAALLLGRRR